MPSPLPPLEDLVDEVLFGTRKLEDVVHAYTNRETRAARPTESELYAVLLGAVAQAISREPNTGALAELSSTLLRVEAIFRSDVLMIYSTKVSVLYDLVEDKVRLSNHFTKVGRKAWKRKGVARAFLSYLARRKRRVRRSQLVALMERGVLPMFPRALLLLEEARLISVHPLKGGDEEVRLTEKGRAFLGG